LANTGVYLQYHADNQNALKPEYYDAIFKRNTDIIAAFSYVTPDAKNIPEADIRGLTAADKAKI